MLSVLITIVHVIVCAVLIVVVLLQHGKSADIAATFGGMGSQTAFGPRGTATVFSRADHMVRHHLHADVHGADLYHQSARFVFSHGQGSNAG